MSAEKLLRQQARGMNKMAETMKMARMAQEGKLGEYLVSKEIRKLQNKANRMVRKAMGLK